MSADPGRFTVTKTACAIALAALLVPFALNVDAQWLKLDDFVMMENFRGARWRALVPEILLTRTTPYARFAFLEHLLFIPFYQEGAYHRAAVNALFLVASGALAGAGLALARTARRDAFAWLGAWLVYSAAVLHTRNWHTLEFKTALYLPLGFALAAALVAYTWRLLDAPSRPGAWQLAGWALLAAASFHMAEVALFAVAAAGIALAVGRRAPLWLPAGVVLWPLAYWAIATFGVPRAQAIEMSGQQGVLLPALLHAAVHATGQFCVEFACFVALLALAVAWAVARPRPGAVPALLLAVALPASGLGLLVLAQMNSLGAKVPGFLSERHASYTQLCLAGGVLAAAGVVMQLGNRLTRALVAAALLVVGGVQLWHRAPALFTYAEARRAELARTFAVRDALALRSRALLATGRELVVFVTDWPLATVDGTSVDPSFLGRYSRDSFGTTFVCAGAGCPRVSFFPSAGPYRIELGDEELEALCGRLQTADVVTVGPGGAVSSLLTSQGVSACAAQLTELRLIDAPGGGPRRTARSSR